MARYGPLLVSPKNLPPGHLSHLVIFSQDFLKKTSPQAKRHKSSLHATSLHFSSLLFTSMSILTSLALINWKANTIHIHISNTQHFPSFLFTSHSCVYYQLKGKNNTHTQSYTKSSIKFVTGGAPYISSKFDHQVVPLVLILNLTTRWRHLY